MSDSSQPTFDEMWSLFKRPTKMNIVLTPRQIHAIGHVIVQWSAFEQQVDFMISMWKKHPNVASEVRARPVRAEFKYRLAHLRDELAPGAIPHDKHVFAQEFAKAMGQAAACKGKRDWFAHGTFALSDNRDEREICVTYKWHKFRIATAKVEALADQIGLLSGWLTNFSLRLHEDVHRALHEKLQQLADQRREPDIEKKPQRQP